MRRLPPLSAIRVFEAAARHEHFTAAAEELGMTQAAVSYQIRALEERVGVKLFERSKGRVQLTDAIVSGGQVVRSIIGVQSRVNSYAHVEDSIVFSSVNIGRHAKIRRAIIDKGVNIPEGVEIGYDVDDDRARGFTITPSGVVVIAKAENIEPVMAVAGN